MQQIYFIGGNESYLIDRQKTILIGKLNEPALNYMEAAGFDENVVMFLNSYPIGDVRKVAYVVVDNISECDLPLFRAYLENDSTFATLIVRFREYDSRKAFYKWLAKGNLIHLFNKEQASAELTALVKKLADENGAIFTQGALTEFLRRENYDNREDITIYNILNDLKNLITYNKQITLQNVQLLVPENEQDKRFGLARMIAKGDIVGLRQQAAYLKGNEIPVLTALLREYRIAYKASYYSQKEIGTSSSAFAGMNRTQLLHGIDTIVGTIDLIKQGKIPSSIVLDNTFLSLAYTQRINM